MKSIAVMVCVLAFLWPCASSAETWGEYVKLRERAEAPAMVPKGGLKPHVIPKDIIVQRISQGQPVELRSNSVLFEYGRADVRPEYMAQVRIIAESLRDPRLSRIPFFCVDGHTCSIGSQSNNCRLSWERAQRIVSYLVDLGVPPGKLRPRGFGEDYPDNDNSSELGRERNRRVVLVGQGMVGSKALSNEQMCREWMPPGSDGSAYQGPGRPDEQRSFSPGKPAGQDPTALPYGGKDIPKGFSVH